METAKRYLKKLFEIDWTGEKQRWMMAILKPFWDSLQTTVE
jgi:hypothetical protein